MDRNPESFQWLILFVFQAIGLILLSQINQSLAAVSLFLFINGLFIAFPALFLPFGQGIALVFLFSLFYDSGESWSIGTSLVPNLTTYTIVYYLRNRIRYDRKQVIKPVILLVNLVLFMYYTVLAAMRFETTSQFIFLNLLHLLVSECVLFVTAGWLVVYQKDLLRMFRIDVGAISRATK